jgi:hypothetical protein
MHSSLCTYLGTNSHLPADIPALWSVASPPRAYSFGVDTWLVEVDVVLPHDMPLHRAHDVGEALQVGDGGAGGAGVCSRLGLM